MATARSESRDPSVGSARVVRKALFASLALAPITIALHYVVHPPETVEFVLAALSLVPLAWLIGEATEHAAEHTGPGIGGFLNATFGNAPELIIALIAVNDGLTDGRPWVAHGKRGREPPARARRLARRRRTGSARPLLELSLVRADRARDAALPHPVRARLGRRPGHHGSRRGVRRDLDRAARRLRRGHVVLAATPPHDARRLRRRDRGLVAARGDRRARRSRPSSPRWSRRSSSGRSRCSRRRSVSPSSSCRP